MFKLILQACYKSPFSDNHYPRIIILPLHNVIEFISFFIFLFSYASYKIKNVL